MISLVVLPSARRHATHARVRGSTRVRTMVIVVMADSTTFPARG